VVDETSMLSLLDIQWLPSFS